MNIEIIYEPSPTTYSLKELNDEFFFVEKLNDKVDLQDIVDSYCLKNCPDDIYHYYVNKDECTNPKTMIVQHTKK